MNALLSRQQWIGWTECVPILADFPNGEKAQVPIRNLYLEVREGESFLPTQYKVFSFLQTIAVHPVTKKRATIRYFTVSSKKLRYQKVWDNPDIAVNANGDHLPSCWTITDNDYSKDETLTRDEMIAWMNARFPHATSKAIDALIMCSEGTSPAFRL